MSSATHAAVAIQRAEVRPRRFAPAWWVDRALLITIVWLPAWAVSAVWLRVAHGATLPHWDWSRVLSVHAVGPLAATIACALASTARGSGLLRRKPWLACAAAISGVVGSLVPMQITIGLALAAPAAMVQLATDFEIPWGVVAWVVAACSLTGALAIALFTAWIASFAGAWRAMRASWSRTRSVALVALGLAAAAAALGRALVEYGLAILIA